MVRALPSLLDTREKEKREERKRKNKKIRKTIKEYKIFKRKRAGYQVLVSSQDCRSHRDLITCWLILLFLIHIFMPLVSTVHEVHFYWNPSVFSVFLLVSGPSPVVHFSSGLSKERVLPSAWLTWVLVGLKGSGMDLDAFWSCPGSMFSLVYFF